MCERKEDGEYEWAECTGKVVAIRNHGQCRRWWRDAPNQAGIQDSAQRLGKGLEDQQLSANTKSMRLLV